MHFLDQMTARAVDVGGTRVRYFVAGLDSSPAMVLIHGYPEMAISWRKTISPLVEAGFYLVMPDLRGAGGSGRPKGGYDKSTLSDDIRHILDDIGIETPAAIVGHDIGAMVAYAFARRFPTRTSRIAILDSIIPGTKVFEDVVRDGRKVWHFHFHQAPDVPEALRAFLEIHGWAFLRSMRLPMAIWIMASETSTRCS